MVLTSGERNTKAADRTTSRKHRERLRSCFGEEGVRGMARINSSSLVEGPNDFRTGGSK